MWDLSESGTEPVSPAVAARFFTTEPPEKPLMKIFLRGTQIVNCGLFIYICEHIKTFTFYIALCLSGLTFH